MAIGLKVDKKASRVFVVLGDGECQEGEVWEAAATANKYQLDNLIAFVDVNNLQIDGGAEYEYDSGDKKSKVVYKAQNGFITEITCSLE